MSHTRSRSWVSDQAKERDKWHHASIRQRNFFPHSHYVPMSLPEWVKQREEMYEARIRRFNRVTAHRAEVYNAETRTSLDYPPIPPLRQPFDGQVFYGNYSAVLCQPTIWCTNWDAGFRFNAPWPGYKELKWEGDDRAATKCGRFPPLPREPANPTVVFHHLRMLLPYPFDEIRRVPTLEDVVAPVDEIDDALIPDLIGTEFLNMIDNIDIC